MAYGHYALKYAIFTVYTYLTVHSMHPCVVYIAPLWETLTPGQYPYLGYPYPEIATRYRQGGGRLG